MFEEIKGSENWTKVEKINKGWSKDSKYYIETTAGEKLLLRITDISRLEAKKKEYDIVTKYSRTGIVMSMPRGFGVFDEGRQVYSILTWIEGEDMEKVLPKLPEDIQYSLGRSAGSILRKIHSIPVDMKDKSPQTKTDKKLKQLQSYLDSDLRYPGDETAVDFIKNNIDKIDSVPPVYQHGDFHPGNLIYMPDHEIGVIDFNRWEVGDPYEEFYKLESFATDVSIPYCRGQIDSYFNDNIPEQFWDVLAVYVAHAALYSIKWAEPFGKKDIDNMVRICRKIFKDYDGFKRSVPIWYRK